jgi:putative oxidoreductase
MSSDLVAIQPTGWKRIAFKVLKIVLGVAFIAFGSAKLLGVGGSVAEFTKVGFGQWFRIFTGLCEISGAVLLLVPGTTVFGAILMAAVSIGAFFAQLRVLHQDIIHPIVLTAILLSIAWSNRVQLEKYRQSIKR